MIGEGHEVSLPRYEDHTFGADVEPRFRGIAERLDRRPVGPVDVHVRHQWPPRLDAPAEGRWVVIQPWEWGSAPKAWIAPFSEEVNEVWVPSRFVRSCYMRSGIPAERIVVVPNGVDTRRFQPEGERFPLRTKKKTKFLFVGGTIRRKGIDVLLDAWSRAFTADDDVCLVVKDLGSKTFYRGQTAQSMIAEYATRPGVAEMIIEDSFDDAMMASLYRSVDALVHPYRGEGFGLPILEAMATGRAVITTGYGPALEFASEECAYFCPAKEVRTGKSSVGDMKPWPRSGWRSPTRKPSCVTCARRQMTRRPPPRRGEPVADCPPSTIGAAFERSSKIACGRSPCARFAVSVGKSLRRGTKPRRTETATIWGPSEPPSSSNGSVMTNMRIAPIASSVRNVPTSPPALRRARRSPSATCVSVRPKRFGEKPPNSSLSRSNSGCRSAACWRRPAARAEAESAYLDALDLDPREPGALLALARLTNDAGRVDESAHFITRAFATSPDRNDVLVAYAEFCLSMGFESGAVTAIERLRERNDAKTEVLRLERRLLAV